MNKARELKKQYGSRYCFRKYLTDRQVAKLKTDVPSSFPDAPAATLEIGCVRLDAVFFHSPKGVELAYDILVKDSPNALEWICYDAIPAKTAKETDMAAALDKYVNDRGLSYIDCCFTRIEGENISGRKEKQK